MFCKSRMRNKNVLFKTNKQWRIEPTRWEHCVFLSASTIELSSVELYQGSFSPYCQISQSTRHHWTAFIYLFIIPLGSKSQSALWNAITAGMGIKGKEQKPLLNDPRSLEEILAEDFPLTDEPDATEKTAIRFACGRLLQHFKKSSSVFYNGVKPSGYPQSFSSPDFTLT